MDAPAFWLGLHLLPTVAAVVGGLAVREAKAENYPKGALPSWCNERLRRVELGRPKLLCRHEG